MRKRHRLLAVVLMSAILWYVLIARGLTGHTKLLWGAHKVVEKANDTGSHIRRAIHRAEGDKTL